MSRAIVLIKIEATLSVVIEDISRNRAPYLQLRDPNPPYSLKKIEYYSILQQVTFTRLINLMAQCCDLISRSEIQNKRDIYYEKMELYKNQSELDRTVTILCSILRVSRWDLNIDAAGKGLISGSLRWLTKNNEVVECRPGIPTLIPGRISDLHSFQSNAEYILVVEKEAVFIKIIEEDGFSTLRPFLLISGKGYPDYATRRFLSTLVKFLSIPVYVFVDADPHGLEIAATYRWGTRQNLDPELCLPNIQLLGLLPSELPYLSSRKCPPAIPLKPTEIKKLDSLECHLRDETWKEEVKVLRATKRKAEIEHLSFDSPNYLTHVYLKSKISRMLNGDPTI